MCSKCVLAIALRTVICLALIKNSRLTMKTEHFNFAIANLISWSCPGEHSGLIQFLLWSTFNNFSLGWILDRTYGLWSNRTKQTLKVIPIVYLAHSRICGYHSFRVDWCVQASSYRLRVMRFVLDRNPQAENIKVKEFVI